MKWQTKVRQGVKRNSSGVKHFLKGVKKNLGGLTPLTPQKSAHEYVIVIRYTSKIAYSNLFRAIENSIEQCFATNIVQCCQQYCSALLHLVAG